MVEHAHGGLAAFGLGDRLARPEQSRLLRERWGRPELHWFPGSHALHFGRQAYREGLRRLVDVAPAAGTGLRVGA